MSFQYLRGSEWSRWDLHLHTPETKKNDQFEGSTPEQKWGKFINSFNTTPEIISAIGITDYFCIDNYFKFKELVSNGSITKPIPLILPNIEIRISPVTHNGTPINIHCIFNPDIDTEIKPRFLARLKLAAYGSVFSAVREDLIRYGKSIPGASNISEDLAYRNGLNQYVVSMDSLREVFINDLDLRDKVIIVVSNNRNDGSSGLRLHSDYLINEPTGAISQLDSTRWSIYQFSDAIFSSNVNDINYFLGYGVDDIPTIISKCHSIMPCYHGCDAHSNNKIFKPDNDRFCWIKSKPTFEGLKQTLYEPEQRVKIQSIQPDLKEDKLTIDQVRFISTENSFTNKPIYFNKNLNVIIGGKSTSKSILLYCIAKTLLSKTDFDKLGKVQNNEARIPKYKFPESFDFEVKLFSGNTQKFSRPDNEISILPEIRYIPQNYLSDLANANSSEEKKKELVKFIRELLLEEEDYKNSYNQFIRNIKNNDSKRENLINTYFNLRDRLKTLREDLISKGSKQVLITEIESIQGKIIGFKKEIGLTDEDQERYNSIIREKEKVESELRMIKNDSIKVEQFSRAFFIQYRQIAEAMKLTLNSLEHGKIAETFKSRFKFLDLNESEFQLLNEYLFNTIKKQVINLNEKTQSNESILNKNLEPFIKDTVIKQNIVTLETQALQSKLKLEQIEQLEKEISDTTKEMENKKVEIFQLYEENIGEYESIVSKLQLREAKFENENLLIDGNVKFEFSEFRSKIDEITDLRKKLPGLEFNIFDNKLTNSTNFSKIELLESIKKIIENIEKGDFPLLPKITKKEAFKKVLDDYFWDYWEVIYDNDPIYKMSTGKASFVILMLIVGLSKSKAPILIDQPEDNLDNRSITKDLVNYLKNKKQERQIILVTHNPNVVVNADAENIIVANQKGQNNKETTSLFQFDYINGPIEMSKPFDELEKDLLKSMGIKEHITDVLEGGKDAFKKREKKYGF